ncbi:hypothetical protein CALCODRAFT_76891 [Calocera cornea HHB12733]|uniref:Arrestin-like N-terminal domain-containing protein n=1 Tax=Calocera cornea HHB12733 TaxID=1353952 RepID=A0A165DH92_9BASI|nr:hypothetical protein CALCODRAFT_76891 [Calocera cornea HHB12733]
MATQDVEVLPAYSPESLPPLYTPRSHDAGPSKPRQHYLFGGGKACLDLGPRVHDTPHPAYGKNDPVEGRVFFPARTPKVTRVTVKLEATLLHLVTERGLPAGHDERVLFTVERELFAPAQPTELDAAASFPFSLDLPDLVDIDGEHFPLPPSGKWFHPGVVAEVSYRVTADISRKGLGRHERLEADVLYLPKTRAVKVLPMSWGLSPNDAKREHIDMTNWATIPLKPHWPKALAGREPAVPLTAELRLPSCFFSGYPPLSFHIHLEIPEDAPHHAQVDLHALSIDIHLVRQVSIAARGGASTTESIVGKMCVYTERSTPTSRDIWGKIGCAVDGQEASWNLAKLVQVMHAAKVDIRPPPHLEHTVPSFMHRQRVWMNTDDWADDAPEREGPALGLYRRLAAI